MSHKVTWFLIIGILSVFIGRYLYFKPTYIENDLVPDFSAKTFTGESFNLNNFKGDYVFIDFWGSWCGPCRRSNPQLRAIYQKYKNARFKEANSFQLVSIGIE
ncbi:MAG: TlpA family protein disulfide reductase, partial [Bacteroidota bacterium]